MLNFGFWRGGGNWVYSLHVPNRVTEAFPSQIMKGGKTLLFISPFISMSIFDIDYDNLVVHKDTILDRICNSISHS